MNRSSRIDFFVIGAAKCGTTSLYKAMGMHPDVFVPEVKEPRFFNVKRGKSWDWYMSLYASKQDHQIAGDFSPSYSISSGSDAVPRRISEAFPGAKIIYMIRNPIDAALSNWQMQAEIRGESPDFMAAVRDPSWTAALFERVLFRKQIDLYRRFFEDECIFVQTLESMSDGAQLKSVLKFLGLDDSVPIRFPRANRTEFKPNRPSRPHVGREDRQRFIDLVKDDAHSILDYCDLPKDHWDLSIDYSGWR